MPGRQAHGRPLLAQPKAKSGPKKSKSRAQTNALNAFNIAQERFPTKEKKTPRARELDAEIEKKHARDEEDQAEEEEEERGPKRKKVKAPQRSAAADGDVEFGSDSEGNEWQLGGMADGDDDSEIESDDAFGESDNDMFQGYAFRGSKSSRRKDGDSDDSDDSSDDQGETLGEDAIDLAAALDQYEEESEEEPEGEEGSESGESEEDEDSDESEGDGSEELGDESDEEADPERLEELKGLISGFGGQGDGDGGEKDASVSKQQKIDLRDLGLWGINDPFMKQSVKLMKKEKKARRPGASKKLDVPLSRREQGRIDRAAAYERTNETLGRWTETVKQNRRAEHLIFPLPQNAESAGLDRTELQPLSLKGAANELEATIMGIMEQSGLSLEKEKKPKKQEFDEGGNLLTRKQVLERKRLEREINSREAKRAKRIKKIKSKAYHRVHRKQRERDEMATREAMEEAGEIDSEEEREAQDRRRALERVGQRHKDSKWAKMGSKAKRAVWDDDFRSGLTEMARKDEELRRRKEGKSSRAEGDDDSDETSSSGSDDDDAADLRRQLDELEREDNEPQSRLMKMKFMQKAEAAKKKANDDLIKEIRRELDGEEAEVSDDEEKGGEVGRRQWGNGAANPFSMPKGSAREAKKYRFKDSKEGGGEEEEEEDTSFANGDGAPHITSGTINHAWSTPAEATSSIAGAWSQGQSRRKKPSSGRADDLDLNANILTASQPHKPNTKSSAAKRAQLQDDQDDVDELESGSDSEPENRLPLAIRDKDLVARAFAGEDVVAEFRREKDEIAEADADRVIDNTLPGWGSWVGEGVSGREKKRHQGRFLTKVEGIKKKDRKDAKLDKVIINEKRIKKNDRYLASQLPFPFESRQQYERALRLPVGPEWMTKETFQDNTKPRVIIKQGIITPMFKPSA
ncbi:UTP14 [Trichoderma cornu-damae]|uniref:UTP14 n=1 Tax=Trichoderma cornu-damae TaxID=654480 RepID=A0A9P8TUS4_9HYPO|nr:UTP14 [Trichoderma cornu-damae]